MSEHNCGIPGCDGNKSFFWHTMQMSWEVPEMTEEQKAANKLEAIFATYWPITYKVWNDNGRSAP